MNNRELVLNTFNKDTTDDIDSANRSIASIRLINLVEARKLEVIILDTTEFDSQ